jgi:hypothetical protein
LCAKSLMLNLKASRSLSRTRIFFFPLRISRCALPRSDDRSCTPASRTTLGIRSPQSSNVEDPSCNARCRSQPSSDLDPVSVQWQDFMLQERLVSVLINDGRMLKSDICRIMLNRLTDMVSTYRKGSLQVTIGNQSAGKVAAWYTVSWSSLKRGSTEAFPKRPTQSCLFEWFVFTLMCSILPGRSLSVCNMSLLLGDNVVHSFSQCVVSCGLVIETLIRTYHEKEIPVFCCFHSNSGSSRSRWALMEAGKVSFG